MSEPLYLIEVNWEGCLPKVFTTKDKAIAFAQKESYGDRVIEVQPDNDTWSFDQPIVWDRERHA